MSERSNKPAEATLRGRAAARVRERGSVLLEEAAERSRPRIVAERLRANALWFAQAALATSLAWFIAKEGFGHPRPVFAPVVALVGVSATLGQRRRYAVEMVIGVALGIGIADALVVAIGDGPIQVGAIVAGAMAAAAALGGGAILVSEAAVSALLVVTVQPPGSGLSGARFLDSLLGGVLALIVTALLPANPAATARRAAAPLLTELAGTLDEIALALEHGDTRLADRALMRARALDTDPLTESVAAGEEMLRLSPFARRARARFGRYARAATQLEATVTTVKALTRASVRGLGLGAHIPEDVPTAVRELAETVRTLDRYFEHPEEEPPVSEHALRAAARATLVLEVTSNLQVSVIVGQVRAAAVDLLRSWGLERDEAEEIVRHAADTMAAEERADASGPSRA
ncbi:MAG TPA: FUSC family protein [Thermoleophilaceae bacterium]